jgi:predicted nuclease with TOPRIM domain
VSDTPNTDREQDILTAQIKAGNSDKNLETAGWEWAREYERERNYLVRKIEKLQNDNFRMQTLLKFYQSPVSHQYIEAIKMLQERISKLMAMLKKLRDFHYLKTKYSELDELIADTKSEGDHLLLCLNSPKVKQD